MDITVVLEDDSTDDIVVVLEEQGPAGANAYELAVSQGFAGTLDDWLASLAAGQIEELPDLALVFENALI